MTDGAATADDGRAIIEVVFLGVLVLIPVIYILIAVMRLQGATLAVAQAARDAGRLVETTAQGPTSPTALAVARTDLRDQGISPEGMHVRTVAPGSDCRTAEQVPPSHAPGTTYDLCVVVTITLPGVPSVLSGSNNTVTGVYTVRIGKLREGP